MTQEDKQLSLKAICGYLPYGLIYHRNDGANIKLEEIDVVRRLFNYTDCPEERDIKPYLRPMSSMTEEEKEEFISFNGTDGCYIKTMDFCHEHHLDNRGLIPMGLALESPEGMYKQN